MALCKLRYCHPAVNVRALYIVRYVSESGNETSAYATMRVLIIQLNVRSTSGHYGNMTSAPMGVGEGGRHITIHGP